MEDASGDLHQVYAVFAYQLQVAGRQLVIIHVENCHVMVLFPARLQDAPPLIDASLSKYSPILGMRLAWPSHPPWISIQGLSTLVAGT